MTVITRHRNAITFCLVLLLAAACELLPQPKTPAEAIAATYATIEAAAVTVEGRTSAGLLTLEAAREARDRLTQALTLTSQAEIALAAGDLSTQEARLEAAIAILTALEEDLRE